MSHVANTCPACNLGAPGTQPLPECGTATSVRRTERHRAARQRSDEHSSHVMRSRQAVHVVPTTESPGTKWLHEIRDPAFPVKGRACSSRSAMAAAAGIPTADASCRNERPRTPDRRIRCPGQCSVTPVSHWRDHPSVEDAARAGTGTGASWTVAGRASVSVSDAADGCRANFRSTT